MIVTVHGESHSYLYTNLLTGTGTDPAPVPAP